MNKRCHYLRTEMSPTNLIQFACSSDIYYTFWACCSTACLGSHALSQYSLKTPRLWKGHGKCDYSKSISLGLISLQLHSTFVNLFESAKPGALFGLGLERTVSVELALPQVTFIVAPEGESQVSQGPENSDPQPIWFADLTRILHPIVSGWVTTV